MYRLLAGLFFVFTVLGCQNTPDLLRDSISETDTPTTETETDTPTTETETDTPTTETETDTPTTETTASINFCKVGDILKPGQSCLDSGTDAKFTVLENGNAQYTSESGLFFESTDVLDARGSMLNDQPYDFLARKRDDGTWIIEQEDNVE